MTRLLVLCALALVCLLLQTALLPAFLPAAVKPELLLLLTVYLMLIEDFFRGVHSRFGSWFNRAGQGVDD